MSLTYDPVTAEVLSSWIPRSPHPLHFTMKIDSADVCFVKKPEHRPHIHVPHPDEKTVIFLRHGQSTANVIRDQFGYSCNDFDIRDAGLTDKGIQQAREISDMVKAWNVECVIVSPLSRAIQTFGHAFDGVFRDPHQRDPEVIISPWVTEFYPEHVENWGRDADALLQDPNFFRVPIFTFTDPNDPVPHTRPSGLFEEILRQYRNLPAEWWAISGEYQRLQDLSDWIHQSPFKRIAVVAHWGLIHAVLAHVPHAPYPWKGHPTIHNCNWIVTSWAPVAPPAHDQIQSSSSKEVLSIV